MYCPFFRGKQFELVVIRENAGLMKRSGFTPIIEPVKESMRGLERALDAIQEVDGRSAVIVNPQHGDLVDRGEEIVECINDLSSAGVAIIADQRLPAHELADLCRRYLKSKPVTLVHKGFRDANGLKRELGTDCDKVRHVFIEENCGKLYRRHFKGKERLLVRDGFKRKKNRDYPEVEPFSDLHVTFDEEGMNGFGDFLIVGDEYSESGGPAYAVAIHMTAIDEDNDQQMVIHHFVSDRVDTPKDPAGKFLEALQKLVNEVNGPRTSILRTGAVDEYLSLKNKGHFPGLGYVKKLSMMHHLETLSRFLAR